MDWYTVRRDFPVKIIAIFYNILFGGLTNIDAEEVAGERERCFPRNALLPTKIVAIYQRGTLLARTAV